MIGLYIDGEDGRQRVWHQTKNANKQGFSGGNPQNLLSFSNAVLDGPNDWSSYGAGQTFIPFTSDLPELSNTGEIADNVINLGVIGIEAIDGTSSAKLTHFQNPVKTYGAGGPAQSVIEAGGWVYIEAGGDRTVRVEIQVRNESDVLTVLHNEDFVVAANTWTYVYTRTSFTLEDHDYVYMELEFQEAGRLAGEKLYLGAAYVGRWESTWLYPMAWDRELLDLRFDMKAIQDGDLLCDEDSNTFTIAIANGAFDITVGVENTYLRSSLVEYNHVTNRVFKYNQWDRFRITHELSTGVINTYIEQEGTWLLVDTGTVTTGSDRPRYQGLGATRFGALTTPCEAYVANIEFAGTNGTSVQFTSDEYEDFLTIGEDLVGDFVQIDGEFLDENIDTPLYVAETSFRLYSETNPSAIEFENKPELQPGTGDFTLIQSLRASLQSGDAAAYSTHDGTDGFDISTDSFTPKVRIGANTYYPSVPIFNTFFQRYMLERDSGVALNFYRDDFAVPVDQFADTGEDLTSTSPARIGVRDPLVTTSYLSGFYGVTLYFNRLLEDYERLDLEYWLDAGYEVEEEPDWLRTEAVLYVNPNDEQQQAAIEAGLGIINLAVDLPDELFIRYTLESPDGVVDPTLSSTVVEFGDLGIDFDSGVSQRPYRTSTRLRTESTGQDPFRSYALDGTTFGFVVPFETFGADWFNSNFTIACWARLVNTGASETIAEQGALGAGTWQLVYNTSATPALEVYIDGVLELSYAADLTKVSHLIELKRDAPNSISLHVDGVEVDTTNGPSITVTVSDDIVFGVAAVMLLGPVHIWTRALTPVESQQVYSLGPEDFAGDPELNVTFSDGIDYQELNWERD